MLAQLIEGFLSAGETKAFWVQNKHSRLGDNWPCYKRAGDWERFKPIE